MLLSLKVHVIIMMQFNFQASYPEVKSKEKRFLNSGGKKIHRTALESTGSVELMMMKHSL